MRNIRWIQNSLFIIIENRILLLKLQSISQTSIDVKQKVINTYLRHLNQSTHTYYYLTLGLTIEFLI